MRKAFSTVRVDQLSSRLQRVWQTAEPESWHSLERIEHGLQTLALSSKPLSSQVVAEFEQLVDRVERKDSTVQLDITRLIDRLE